MPVSKAGSFLQTVGLHGALALKVGFRMAKAPDRHLLGDRLAERLYKAPPSIISRSTSSVQFATHDHSTTHS